MTLHFKDGRRQGGRKDNGKKKKTQKSCARVSGFSQLTAKGKRQTLNDVYRSSTFISLLIDAHLVVLGCALKSRDRSHPLDSFCLQSCSGYEMLSIGSMQCVKRPNSLRRSIPDVFSIHGFSLSHPELLIIMPSFCCFHIFQLMDFLPFTSAPFFSPKNSFQKNKTIDERSNGNPQISRLENQQKKKGDFHLNCKGKLM